MYSAAGKYVDQSWKHINRSQTHECGNWDWGRAIPFLGMHKWVFRCSAQVDCRKCEAYSKQWGYEYSVCNGSFTVFVSHIFNSFLWIPFCVNCTIIVSVRDKISSWYVLQLRSFKNKPNFNLKGLGLKIEFNFLTKKNSSNSSKNYYWFLDFLRCSSDELLKLLFSQRWRWKHIGEIIDHK